jgi:hypothetical protein
MNKLNYAHGLAEMIPWNLTTVIRTHYRMKPHIIDKKVQELIKSPKVNHVFYTLEDDFELDYHQNTQKINHAHLLISGKSTLSRDDIIKQMGLNSKALLDIQRIRGEKAIANQITLIKAI